MSKYAMTDAQLRAWRKSLNEEGGVSTEGREEYFRPVLPYRFLEVEKPERSWTNADGETMTFTDRRVYRFFGFIGTKLGSKMRNGKQFVNVVCDPVSIHRVLVQRLFWGVAPLDQSIRIPRELRSIPVTETEYALARATRLVQGKAVYETVHPANGVLPREMYWAACIVKDIVGYEDEQRTIPIWEEAPAFLQLSTGQAKKLGMWFDEKRDEYGSGWLGTGVPVTVQSVGDGLRCRVVGTEKTWDMTEMPMPDLDTMVEAVRHEFDAFLRSNGAQIADFPEQGSNPDGWSTKVPYAVELGITGRTGDDEEHQVVIEAAAPAAPAASALTEMPRAELVALLASKGVKANPRWSRERLLAAAEEISPLG